MLVSGGLDKRILLWDLQRMSAPLMVLRAGGGGGEADEGGTGAGAGAGASWGGRRTSSSAKLAVDAAADSSQAGGEDGKGRAGAAAVSPWWDDADGEVGAWAHLRNPSRVVLRPGQAATGPNEVLELCRQNKGSVHCIDAAADASLVASGGTDRMIRLLDPRAGGGAAAKICKLDGHGDNVRCVKIDEGGTRVVGVVMFRFVLDGKLPSFATASDDVCACFVSRMLFYGKSVVYTCWSLPSYFTQYIP